MRHIKQEYNYTIHFLSLLENEEMVDYYSGCKKYLKNIPALQFGPFETDLFFIPEIEGISVKWPPEHDENNLLNERAFFLSLIYNNEFNITPCNKLAGQVKIIDYQRINDVLELNKVPKEFHGPKRSSKVFFVTQEEFQLFVKELKSKGFYSKGSSFTTESLEEKFKLPFFIKNFVLQQLRPIVLGKLGRVKDVSGNIVKL